MIKLNQKTKAILKISGLFIGVLIIIKVSLIFLSPFVAAVLVVIVLEPSVKYLCKLGLKRKYSVIISFIVMTLLLLLIVAYVSNYLISQLIIMIECVPQALDEISKKISHIVLKKIDYTSIISTLKELIPLNEGKLYSTVLSTANGTVFIILTAMIALYLSCDLYSIIHKVQNIIPRKMFVSIKKSILKMNKIINVQIKLVVLTTLETILGLWVLGVSHPLTIGTICGILDILPVVGPAIIFIPWSIYSLIQKQYIFAIGINALFILIGVVRKFMEIKYVGGSLDVHPVATIFSLYVGVLLYGVWGVVIGPLIIVIFTEIISMYYDEKRGFTI